MKKKTLVLSLFIFIFSFINLYSWEPPFGWPTREYLGLSYSQGFNLRAIKGDTPIVIKGTTGSFKYDRSIFFRNHNIGFGFTFEFGGPYFFSIEDLNTRNITPIKATDLDIGFSNLFGIGVAFDHPINSNLSLNAIIGPSFDIWKVKMNNQSFFSFQFGPYLSMGLRFTPNKVAQFRFGIDLSYSFLQAGFIKNGSERQKLETFVSSLDIRPYIGVSFRLDSFYDKWRNTHRK